MSRRQARVVATLTFVSLMLMTTQRAIAPGPLPWPPLLVFYSDTPPPPPIPAPPGVTSAQRCYAVGFPGTHPVKTVDRQPVYPRAARAAGIRGVVIISVIVDEQGNVIDPRILRSIPLLDRAALDAVRGWKFTPASLDGRPVCVNLTVTVNFP